MPSDRFECLPDPGRVAVYAYLHPSTDPGAIRRDQRRAVREAVSALRARGADPTPEAVSAEAVLPVSVVRRRLAEMKRQKAG